MSDLMTKAIALTALIVIGCADNTGGDGPADDTGGDLFDVGADLADQGGDVGSDPADMTDMTDDGRDGVDAGPIAPTLGEALACGRPGPAGRTAPGQSVFRVDVDRSAYPEAVCNDGTGAVFYVRRSGSGNDENRWVIRLQGGGGCASDDSCAQRWCSLDTNFGMDKMSSSLAPPDGAAAGGVNANRADNPRRDWNHVFVHYCSSDNWAGSASAVQATASNGSGQTVDYTIHFHGADIVDAVIGMLRREHGEAVTYLDAAGDEVTLPNLDDAAEVLFSGASAGGGGAIQNLDRVADTLAPIPVWGLIDSAYGPDRRVLGLEQTRFCTEDGLCDGDALDEASVLLRTALRGQRSDASCQAWHEANAPDLAWRCGVTNEVLTNHLTTPFFVRMDQYDSLIMSNTIEAGYTYPSDGDTLITEEDFAAIIREQMSALPDIVETAREADAITVAPGYYAPSCGRHEAIGNSGAVYDTAIEVGEVQYTMDDVIANWLDGDDLAGLIAEERDRVCP